MKTGTKPTSPQHARFMEAARVIGADEDMAAFRAKLAVIARQKPKEEVPPAPPLKPTAETE